MIEEKDRAWEEGIRAQLAATRRGPVNFGAIIAGIITLLMVLGPLIAALHK